MLTLSIISSLVFLVYLIKAYNLQKLISQNSASLNNSDFASIRQEIVELTQRYSLVLFITFMVSIISYALSN